MAQSTFSQNIAAGAPGQLALSAPHRILSCINTGTVELLPGYAVAIEGSSGNNANEVFGVQAPVASTDKILGIVMLETGRLPDSLGVASPVAVVAAGTVYVIPAAAVSAGDAAYVVSTTGQLTNVSSGNIALPAVFRGNSNGSAPVAVEINLP